MGKISFTNTEPASHSGNTNTWLTPLWLIEELGKFDLDPCAFAGHNTASELIILPECGLSAEWNGRVWLNPPYGKEAVLWLEKLQAHGNGIALLFQRLSTKWIQPFIRDGFFVLEKRIAFLKEDFTGGTNAGTGSILIPFGRKNVGAILSSDLPGIWVQ